MDLKMKSLILLVLYLYGLDDVIAQDDLNPLDADIWDYDDGTTLAPSTAVTCTVSGLPGICVPSMAYCSTKNYGEGAITWRTTGACREGICCKREDAISNPKPPTVDKPTPGSTVNQQPGSSTGGAGGSINAPNTQTPGSTVNQQPGSSTGGGGGSVNAPNTQTPGSTVNQQPGCCTGGSGGSINIPNTPNVNQQTPGSSANQQPPKPTPGIPPNVVSTTATCGIQKPQTVPGYVKTKSNEANPGEFPWSVNLMILTSMTGSKGRYRYTGTGSLIHDRVVLTAAHVLVNKDIRNLKAVFGEHDQLKKVLPKKLGAVDEVVLHDNFDSRNGDFNIGLAFLKRSALAGLPHVGTVCLPPQNYQVPVGLNCAFAGWGLDSAQKAQLQLVKTVVPIVDHDWCQQKLQASPKLGPGFQLLQSLMCAGGEVGKDVCGGAGGSPLVCPIQGDGSRYVQTGIVSWVLEGCGVDGSPLVFADVAAARPWIDQKMTEHQYSTESYTY